MNQDTAGATRGFSGGVIVGLTSQAILAAPTIGFRRAVTIINRDATNPVYINYGVGATAATTENASLQKGEQITLNVGTTIWGIATGAPVSLEYFSEDDV